MAASRSSTTFGSVDCIVDVMGYFSAASGRAPPAARPRPIARHPLRASASLRVDCVGGSIVDLPGRRSRRRSGRCRRGGRPQRRCRDAERFRLRHRLAVGRGSARRVQPQLRPRVAPCRTWWCASWVPAERVSIFANAGDLDLIADVIGCFTGSGPSLVAVAPTRLLDTRHGSAPGLGWSTEAPRSISRSPESVAWLPARTAVILNVTATDATADTLRHRLSGRRRSPRGVEPQRDGR